jgi:hypothetical protein
VCPDSLRLVKDEARAYENRSHPNDSGVAIVMKELKLDDTLAEGSAVGIG